jgi:iron complex outermembrane receptor protein
MDKSNPETDEGLQIEAMTVTAQKQEEDVQEVPISISVFNDQIIEDRKIESIFDIADFVPNFTLVDFGSSGRSAPSMRGLSAPGTTLSVSTGMYVDGVPVLSVMGYDSPIVDIERVEVLRGPQGTLYGKNAQAGVINIITRQPDNEFRGKISAQGSSYLSTETGDGLGGSLTASVSGPLIEDRLFVGFSGKYMQKDGYLKNIATGDTVNDKEHFYGRGHLRWTPTDQLDISLIVAYTEFDDGGTNLALTELGASELKVPYNGDRKVASGEEFDTSTNSTQALKITYDFSDALQLTSVTSHRVYNDRKLTDFDNTQETLWYGDLDTTYEKIAQELRLSYQKGKLKWLGGIFYDHDDDEGAGVKRNLSEGDSYAIYTNLTYPLLDALNVVGGLRYEYQEKDKTMYINSIKTFEGDESWGSITPKLALEYFVSPSIMTYISAGNGFRSGGFSQATIYDEEELWSYEIGMKSSFLDNRLVVNAAAYYMDIENMQVLEALTPTTSRITNAAEATGIGFELDVTARLVGGLSVIAGFGYNHIEYDKFEDANGNYEGNMASYSPEYTFNIGAQYRHSNGFYARVDFIAYDEMYDDYANLYGRDAYQVVNAKIGYETDRFDIYLYGDNIFDEKYDIVGYSGGFYNQYSEPGAIGLQLNYRF